MNEAGRVKSWACYTTDEEGEIGAQRKVHRQELEGEKVESRRLGPMQADNMLRAA